MKRAHENISNNSIEKVLEVISRFKLLKALTVKLEDILGCQEGNIRKLADIAVNLPKMIDFKFFLK